MISEQLALDGPGRTYAAAVVMTAHHSYLWIFRKAVAS